jgi:hypothetical protein
VQAGADQLAREALHQRRLEEVGLGCRLL